MNSGIYSLYWEKQDLIYIGLSQNLKDRFKEHIYLMRNNRHTNYRVQNAYNLYGEPSINVLEHCQISELPAREIFWCKEFDALNPKHGLCLVEPGIIGFGPKGNNSKYSKIRILRIFSLLYRGKLCSVDIATRLHVHTSIVNDICRGKSHLWLQEEYPVKYARMLSINRKAIYDSSKLRGIVQDTNTKEIHYIYNISEFCRVNLGSEGYKSSIHKLLSDKTKRYKHFVKYVSRTNLI